jgi:hypothetical protein
MAKKQTETGVVEMMWKLWLDDQLDDPDAPARHTPAGYIGAKSSEKARELVIKHGVPGFMNLDHDLGENDRAMDFLHWLALEFATEGPVPDFAIHSANPIGSANITSFMYSWKRSADLGPIPSDVPPSGI